MNDDKLIHIVFSHTNQIYFLNLDFDCQEDNYWLHGPVMCSDGLAQLPTRSARVSSSTGNVDVKMTDSGQLRPHLLNLGVAEWCTVALLAPNCQSPPVRKQWHSFQVYRQLARLYRVNYRTMHFPSFPSQMPLSPDFVPSLVIFSFLVDLFLA